MWDWQHQYVVRDLKENHISNVQCAMLRNTLYIYCTIGSAVDNSVVFISTNMKRWSVRYAPRQNGAFTAHKFQLLIIGGRAQYDFDRRSYFGEALLQSSHNGFDWEDSSLPKPPKEFSGSNLRAVSNNDLVFLSSAHGETPTCVLCVLIEEQWHNVSIPPLAGKITHLTIHREELFLSTDQCVHHCALQSLVAPCLGRSNVHDDSPFPAWKELPALPDCLVSFGQHLVGFDKSVLVHALPWLTDSWIQIADIPSHIQDILCASVHPLGDLLLVHGAESLKLCVCRVKLRG